MSATIKLSSRMPGDDEINGLDSLVPELLRDPTRIVCALTWFKVKDVRRLIEHAEGQPDEIPTVEIARVEPIATAEHVREDVKRLAAELYEKRTGNRPLPFEQLVGARDAVYVTQSPEFLEEG